MGIIMTIKKFLKLLVKYLLHSYFSLVTWLTKLLMKQLVDHPPQILSNYVHISWRTFQLLWLFFEAFIWQINLDHFYILLTLKKFLVLLRYTEISPSHTEISLDLLRLTFDEIMTSLVIQSVWLLQINSD